MLNLIIATFLLAECDAANTQQVVVGPGMTTTLSGFTYTVDSSTELLPGAIAAYLCTGLTVKSCTFTGCKDTGHAEKSFAGIAMELPTSTAVTVDKCTFTKITGGSVGVLAPGSNLITVTGCTFTDNTAADTTTFGIISTGTNVVLTMKKCSFSKCTASASSTSGAAIAAETHAAGLTLNWEECDLFNCILTPSSGYYGAGAFGIVTPTHSATLNAKKICFGNNTGPTASDIYLSYDQTFSGSITDSKSTSRAPRHNDEMGVVKLPDGECHNAGGGNGALGLSAPVWAMVAALIGLVAALA